MNYVIFDIDGTLTNTKEVEGNCFMKAFEETFGIDIWNQKWENFKNVTDWGITEEIILQKKNRVPSKIEFESMISNFVKNLNEEKIRDITQFDEVKGAKNFFNELQKDEEIELGIATGSWRNSAILKLNAIGISVDGICFSNSDCFKSREAITRDVINQLAKRTSKTPDRIIYFGDGEWDLKTCNTMGIDFIGIDIKGDDKLNNLGAKTVFRNYTNKSALLNEIKKA